MYIALDNEMGGVTLDYSLLTTYLVVLDENLNKVDELELALKPNDGIYRVCGRAMEVNKIDLKEHDKVAIYYKEAGSLLYQFLNKNASTSRIPLVPGVGKINRLTPIGHGIYGDIAFLTHYLMKEETWETFVSYRKLDTQAVAQFLKACGKIPDTVSGSLESLAKHFEIITEGANGNVSYVGLYDCIVSLHNAKVDTMLTVEVFKKMKELI